MYSRIYFYVACFMRSRTAGGSQKKKKKSVSRRCALVVQNTWRCAEEKINVSSFANGSAARRYGTISLPAYRCRRISCRVIDLLRRTCKKKELKEKRKENGKKNRAIVLCTRILFCSLRVRIQSYQRHDRRPRDLLLGVLYYFKPR